VCEGQAKGRVRVCSWARGGRELRAMLQCPKTALRIMSVLKKGKTCWDAVPCEIKTRVGTRPRKHRPLFPDRPHARRCEQSTMR
jgi:hypothetical protein